MKNHTVATGDTLFGLAEREYGDGTLYPVITLQNHVADPDVIAVGQQLLIPYVTYRHLFTTADSTAARQKLTQHYYGTQDTNVQLIWEIVNGVAQREIQQGAWLHMPDLADVGHHTVVAGETLDGLAARWYGDDHLASIIGLANGLPSGTDPTPGQVLIVPGLNRRRRVAGDTLESLCRDEYGDADLDTRTAVAAAANHISSPDALFANQVVYFPS
jgi:nucleoid-associated protein YgaU